MVATVTGVWYLQRKYRYGYVPVCAAGLLLGAAGLLSRVGTSTRAEGTERRYFYGAVWAVVVGQTVLLFWKTLPNIPRINAAKVAAYVLALLAMSVAAYRGALPRMRPIVAGEWVVAG